jgi:hypothetical protein
MKRIIEAISRFGRWVKFWLWEKPVQKPAKEKPVRLKAVEVIDEWMVVQYHGQRIGLHRNEYPLWKELSRNDKRAMAKKTAKQEREGKIRFETINGKLTCVKNKDYGAEKMSK